MVYFYTKPFLSIYIPKSPISFLNPIFSVISFFYLSAFLVPVGPKTTDPILWNCIDTLGRFMALAAHITPGAKNFSIFKEEFPATKHEAVAVGAVDLFCTIGPPLIVLAPGKTINIIGLLYNIACFF